MNKNPLVQSVEMYCIYLLIISFNHFPKFGRDEWDSIKRRK